MQALESVLLKNHTLYGGQGLTEMALGYTNYRLSLF